MGGGGGGGELKSCLYPKQWNNTTCGDYKTTINKEIKRDQHPIPITEKFAARLGKRFSTMR